MNFLGIDSPGSMQDSWNVPANLVVPLPDGLPLDQAALTEPVAVAVHDVRRANVAMGDQVVVVGGGPIGVLIARVAQLRGARVLLVEPDEYRRGVAAGIGIDTVDPVPTDVTTAVADRTGGALADVAFEVSGSALGVDTAISVLTTRGRLVMVAIHPQPRQVNLHSFFWRELELLGARLYRREDMEEAVRLLAGGRIAVQPLISRIEPLGEVAAAFAALAGGGVMKVLLDSREETR
ncbi:zinc-binding dehydrogenase [Actinoplanes sp. NPDC023801]|uniref:zinc-binding dehydrogenase n=1 Tax=Actinoplanes sp. NPDC023801 TaxID=3154595 RepID=UPI0033C05904